MNRRIGTLSSTAFLIFAFFLTTPAVIIAAQKSFKELLQQSKKYYASGNYELFFKDLEIDTYSQNVKTTFRLRNYSKKPRDMKQKRIGRNFTS